MRLLEDIVWGCWDVINYAKVCPLIHAGKGLTDLQPIYGTHRGHSVVSRLMNTIFTSETLTYDHPYDKCMLASCICDATNDNREY